MLLFGLALIHSMVMLPTETSVSVGSTHMAKTKSRLFVSGMRSATVSHKCNHLLGSVFAISVDSLSSFMSARGLKPVFETQHVAGARCHTQSELVGGDGGWKKCYIRLLDVR